MYSAFPAIAASMNLLSVGSSCIIVNFSFGSTIVLLIVIVCIHSFCSSSGKCILKSDTVRYISAIISIELIN
jgi:hypothetical protein